MKRSPLFDGGFSPRTGIITKGVCRISTDTKIEREWDLFFSQGSYGEIRRAWSEAFPNGKYEGQALYADRTGQAFEIAMAIIENRFCGYKAEKYASPRGKEWHRILKRRENGEYTPLEEVDWEARFFAPPVFTLGFKDGSEKKMGAGSTFMRGCASDRVTTSMRVEMLIAYEGEMLRLRFAGSNFGMSDEIPEFLHWYKRMLRLRLSMMDSPTEPVVPSGSQGSSHECVYNPTVEDACDLEKINPWMLPRSELMAGLGYAPHEAGCVRGALNHLGERTCPMCKAECEVHYGSSPSDQYVH